MKVKILVVMMVSALVLAISGPAQAFLLPTSPFIQKTWNYEIGTFYVGGDQTPGSESTFYFRTPATQHYTEEYGLISPGSLPGGAMYGGLITGNPNLMVFKDPSLKANEDNWGLIRISEYRVGDISTDPTSIRFGNFGISAAVGPAYWTEGKEINGHETYLRGMMWGGEDQVIEVTTDGEYKIWAAGGEFSIWEVLDDPGYNPAQIGQHTPSDRPVVPDEFPDWFDKANDELMADGTIDYFRFQGDMIGQVDGTTDLLASFTGGAWLDTGYFMDYWMAPQGTPSDLWQTWNIGDPHVMSNNWTLSEDSGRGYYIGIPEPLTMLGVLLGVSSLGGYLRRRRQESLA
jgi:hypothetical protein